MLGSIVTVDARGRVVIPKNILGQLHKPRKLLVASKRGFIVMKAMDSAMPQLSKSLPGYWKGVV